MPQITAPDGTRLHYTDEGAGIPLLCLSGLTRTTRDFDYALPHLTGARVIRMDYRGRGQSDWADHRSYTLQQEAADALQLLDHLGLDRAAILGTSRGGLIAMGLGLGARERLLGVCLNDIGPELDPKGLEVIMGYLGRNPAYATHAEMAAAMPGLMTGFANVPASRWLEEVQKHYTETPRGLQITYDPKLRDAVEEAGATAAPDLWPFFEALAGLPVAVIRGANSDLLSAATVVEMARRHPGLIAAEVPDRAHIPFLDEPESVAALRAFLAAVTP
ncbi:alpha/beta hydrolase [Dinoroseobacter sp. PD6]|uniref:alpha/beta fold hydrolase n=1 Tax=Dinoroseobacter sp. PD6 TaxID=3028384 RepID=UPI00237C1F9B|nr:alpha/beta hydrolase [Dinoroseobacter sp. PD6]MDD9717603.1 alpha/beta hydrolase [Dinoroseobacter sp. PD6]